MTITTNDTDTNRRTITKVTRDVDSSPVTDQDTGHETYDFTRHVDKSPTGEVSDLQRLITSEVLTAVDAKDRERQSLEDARSIKRNRNRMYTLLGAVLIGLLITWTLPHLGHFGMMLAPYSFIVTVLFDSSFTLYAYLRRY